MKGKAYQVGSRDLNEEPTKPGAEDGLVQKFPGSAMTGHKICIVQGLTQGKRSLGK